LALQTSVKTCTMMIQYVLIYIHHQELVKSVGSQGSSLLLSMMEVKV
jgi:hypothetical protein